jgi:hypothetical protein
LEGKAIEEIGNFLECGGGSLCENHQVGVAGFAAAVLTLAAAFFFGFPAACLAAAIDLMLGFFGYGGGLDDSHFRTT